METQLLIIISDSKTNVLLLWKLFLFLKKYVTTPYRGHCTQYTFAPKAPPPHTLALMVSIAVTCQIIDVWPRPSLMLFDRRGVLSPFLLGTLIGIRIGIGSL